MAKPPICDCDDCEKCRQRAYKHAWYLRNRERVLAGQKAKRDADPEAYRTWLRNWRAGRLERERELARARYRRNPEKVAARHRDRLADPIEREKRRAREMVKHALADGRLERQPCEECGARAQAHHENYTKPLEVVWLCTTHHAAVHRKTSV